jgi:hypothetical protein
VSVRAVAYIKLLTVCPNGEYISRSEKFVGMVLGDNHQDRAHRRTYPSVEGMAEDAMMSERQFLRLLASLESKGVIRREYPDGRGRGKTTFYFFPELDEKPAEKKSFGADSALSKGCQNVTLSVVDNPTHRPAERVTFLSEKGDRRVTKPALPYMSNKSNVVTKSKDTPQPPASGGAVVSKIVEVDRFVELAIDQVMHGCGFVRRRLRRVLRLAIEHQRDKGETPPTIALAMIAAWREQGFARADGLLRVHFSTPEKFYGDGHWNKPASWHWDEQALERKREAGVGRKRSMY